MNTMLILSDTLMTHLFILHLGDSIKFNIETPDGKQYAKCQSLKCIFSVCMQ